ncbi:hypothetical protein SDC9_126917 [bioreactor metagenome]|uniref:Uncharacterized protein n=1 Tax=bioreactor metagenome TaxID=1076179 RepID=A0A645CSK8_9ZZZZ
MNRRSQFGISRNFAERNGDELPEIAFKEGGRFQRGGEHFGINAFEAMIGATVDIGVADRFIGRARTQTSPDFAADPGAVAVFEAIVVDRAGQGREQAVVDVEPAVVVLAARRDDMVPEFAHEPRRELLQSPGFDRRQPDQLQIEVIVGRRDAVEFLGVKCDVVGLHLAFHRRAERPADVLAGPTAADLVEIFIEIQMVHRFLPLYTGSATENIIQPLLIIPQKTTNS